MEDAVDRQIVAEVSRDGRVTLADLSAAVGLSVSAVQARLKRLEARGVITGYRATVDAGAVGRPLAAFIEITPLDPAQPTPHPTARAPRCDRGVPLDRRRRRLHAVRTRGIPARARRPRAGDPPRGERPHPHDHRAADLLRAPADRPRVTPAGIRPRGASPIHPRRMPRSDRSRSVESVFRSPTRTQLVVDVVVGGVFALLVLPVDLSIGRFTAANALGTALVAVLMGGALAVRRLSPALALTVAWVGALVQMAMGRPPSLADVAIFGVLYCDRGVRFATRVLGGAHLGRRRRRRDHGVRHGSCDCRSLRRGQHQRRPRRAHRRGVRAPASPGRPGALVRTGIRARENRRAQREVAGRRPPQRSNAPGSRATCTTSSPTRSPS